MIMLIDMFVRLLDAVLEKIAVPLFLLAIVAIVVVVVFR